MDVVQRNTLSLATLPLYNGTVIRDGITAAAPNARSFCKEKRKELFPIIQRAQTPLLFFRQQSVHFRVVNEKIRLDNGSFVLEIKHTILNVWNFGSSYERCCCCMSQNTCALDSPATFQCPDRKWVRRNEARRQIVRVPRCGTQPGSDSLTSDMRRNYQLCDPRCKSTSPGKATNECMTNELSGWCFLGENDGTCSLVKEALLLETFSVQPDIGSRRIALRSPLSVVVAKEERAFIELGRAHAASLQNFKIDLWRRR